MGRGNTCTFGKYEGLYFVDKDFLDIYINNLAEVGDDDEYVTLAEARKIGLKIENLDFDNWSSQNSYDEFIDQLKNDFSKKFKSFQKTERFERKCGIDGSNIILENNLYKVAVEDNEWSYAVKLIQKESFEGLQKKHFETYLLGLRNTLFEQFSELGTYKCAWTSGTVRKEEVLA